MPTADGRLTAGELAALLALVQAQAAVRKQLTDAAVSAVTTILQGIGSWWDTRDTTRAIDRIVRVMVPTQRRLAQTTDAYLARALTVMTGRPVRPVGAVEVTRLRRAINDQDVQDLLSGRRLIPHLVIGDTVNRTPSGPVPQPVEVPIGPATAVNPPDVWGRVADAYRYQVVAHGLTEPQALRRAVQRATAVAQTDMALAVRAQSRRVLQQRQGQDRIIGYRRVLHPELSQSGPCGLCVVAADRVYSVRSLMPLHDRCVCEPLPVTRTVDPGLNLNRDDLNRLYEAAGGTTSGPALKRVRVAITEHGELGPILVDADHRVRGPRKVAETKAPDQATRSRAQLESLEKSLQKFLQRRERGENVDGPVKWQTDKIASLRRELGV